MLHLMKHSFHEFLKGRPDLPRDAVLFLEIWHAILQYLWRKGNQVKKKHDLSPPQLGLLYHVEALGPIHLSRLLQHMPGHLSSLTQVVDRMEEHGWVVRRRDAKDRRRVLIDLTPKARKTLARIQPFGLPRAMRSFLAMDAKRRRKAFEAVRTVAGLFGVDPDSLPRWTPGRKAPAGKPGGGSS